MRSTPYKPRHGSFAHIVYTGQITPEDNLTNLRAKNEQPVSDSKEDNTSAERSSGSGTSSDSSSTTSATHSSIIMFLGTLISRALGMVRSPMMLGAVVGLSSPAASSFDIANNVPNTLYGVLAGGLINAALVPAIVKASEKGRDGGAQFINKIMTFAVVTIGIITLLITLSAPLVVELFASAMPDDWKRVTIVFSYWCLPQIFFYGMYAVLGQILNARENFGPYMWSPALNNIVAIAGLLVMLWMFGGESATSPSQPADWNGTRTLILAGSATLGIATQALILLIPIYRLGIRLSPDFKWKGSGLGETGRIGSWAFGIMLAALLPTISIVNVSSAATSRAIEQGIDPVGVANNFTYTAAWAIYTLPTSLVTVSIVTALFPRMARAVVRRNIPALRADASVTLRTIVAFNALATAVIVVMAVPISRLLVPSAEEETIFAMAAVLVAIVVGLIGSALVSTLSKIFFAFQDTKTAFLTVAPFQMLSVPFFFATGTLPVEWVVVGACLVNAILNYVMTASQWIILSRRMGGMDDAHILTSLVRSVAVATITGFVGWGAMALIDVSRTASSVIVALVSLAIIGTGMCGVYLGLLRLFKCEEAELLLKPLDRIRKRFHRSQT